MEYTSYSPQSSSSLQFPWQIRWHNEGYVYNPAPTSWDLLESKYRIQGILRKGGEIAWS